MNREHTTTATTSHDDGPHPTPGDPHPSPSSSSTQPYLRIRIVHIDHYAAPSQASKTAVGVAGGWEQECCAFLDENAVRTVSGMVRGVRLHKHFRTP